MERISSAFVRAFSFKSGNPSKSRSSQKLHSVHKSTHPAYPARAEVRRVSWQEADENYQPVEFTHQAVLDNDRSKKQNGWADPRVVTPELSTELAERVSSAVEIGARVIMVNGLPRNPMGRTGMTGRGLLGKYGPNYAADPLVTRVDPVTGKLQMVAIQRSDNKLWAIPGGMVEAGHSVSETLRREFMEEARNLSKDDEKEVTVALEKLFASGGETVYIGYVDDPRNTDIAWMETNCVHFHIRDEYLARNLRLEAGDDATKARWLDISDEEPDFRNLYASHRDMVIRALQKSPSQFGSTLEKLDLA